MKPLSALLTSLITLCIPTSLFAATFTVTFKDFPLYDQLDGLGMAAAEPLTATVDISIHAEAKDQYQLTLHHSNTLPFFYEHPHLTTACDAYPCILRSPGTEISVEYVTTVAHSLATTSDAHFRSKFEYTFEPVPAGRYKAFSYRNSLTLPDVAFQKLLRLKKGASLEALAFFDAYHTIYEPEIFDDFSKAGTGLVTFTARDPALISEPIIAAVPIPASVGMMSGGILLLGTLRKKRRRASPAPKTTD